MYPVLEWRRHLSEEADERGCCVKTLYDDEDTRRGRDAEYRLRLGMLGDLMMLRREVMSI